VLSIAPVGRRRRPSGEPPPLPRSINRSTRWYLLLGAATVALWLALAFTPSNAVVTRIDLAVVRALAHLRTPWATSAWRSVDAAMTDWLVPIVGWGTIAVLLAFRRFQHLAAYLVVVLAAALTTSAVALWLGRMRPAGVAILGDWDGYAQPSRPVTRAAFLLTGALFTLVPAGRWRARGTWLAAAALVLLGVARVYLALDHPTDVLAALVAGGALPAVAFRLAVPEEVAPVSYHGGRKAHLQITGPRGAAIRTALDHQLGLDVVAIEPFGREGSAGATPLRLRARVRRPGEGGANEGGEQDGGGKGGEAGEGAAEEVALFAKLYARTHLRSDRFYKLARTILYGRLEDEKPFSTVRRLVEYEDHLLRLLRDAGLPTPQPYGFVEITPEREYLIVTELFAGAEEVGRRPLGTPAIDDGLATVRRLWDAGVAHRDIKSSNLLVRGERVLLIDVAFAAVRPTPWRQAVDLANMMLTLALVSTPELVYERALEHFAPDDIAEAFAASRSVTIPTQLRARLRADGRDLHRRFCDLAPARKPVAVQLWSIRRVALTLAVLLGALVAVPALLAYVRLAGLL
jgi:tRNA A-37 threonylcarbamoyl transferase component Bud32